MSESLHGPAMRRADWQDPRVLIQPGSGTPRIIGSRCSSCGAASVLNHSYCLSCGAPMTPTELAAGGALWASTVVRIPVGPRQPPYTLAYVDLADGPRLLCHVVDADERAGAFPDLRIGEPMTVIGTNDAGDPIARSVVTKEEHR